MARYNKGMISTNDNCINCNRCVFECPVMGANVTVNHKNRFVVEVNENICISCGHCLNVCSHDAREYKDDTDRFFDDLRDGKRIALAVSPAFYKLYPELAPKVFSYLRTLGLGKIYDVSFGADLMMWSYLKYFEENADEKGRCHAFITQTCPAVINYIETCLPEYVDRILPIQSPEICLGIYLKEIRHEESSIALISPCVTTKSEIESPETRNVIQYNVTISHLVKYLQEEDLNLYPDTFSDLPSIGLGAVLPIRGGAPKYFEYLTTDPTGTVTGAPLSKDAFRMKTQIAAFITAKNPPLLLDLNGCPSGCVGGPARSVTKRLRGVHPRRGCTDGSGDNEMYQDITARERREILMKAFEGIDPMRFSRTFSEKYCQVSKIPTETYEEIFAMMYKTTRESRNIDCKLCGYNTCRELVTAIAYGYGHADDCIHYAKEKIARLYAIDDLTGLYKETAGIEQALRFIAKHTDQKITVCYAGLNQINVVNEIYGFEAGDSVVRCMSQKLMDFVAGDGICVKLSATEAIFICVNAGEKLRRYKEIKFFNMHDIGIDMQITMKMGVYEPEKGDKDIRRAIGYAALAAKTADDESQNTFTTYDEVLRSKMVKDANVAAQMHDALQKQEFCAYLQPQINHATGKLYGAEVLCRWIKQDGTIISPGDFIKLFEKNGFICELDKYMWDLTFRLMRGWLDAGLSPVPISTNISRISLLRTNVAEEFEKLLQKYEVAPEWIHLEITESAYMEDQDRIVDMVTKLQAMGFLIAMDDFGSGYSSLNTLKAVPIDILKLDMGFFRDDKNNNKKGGNIIFSVMRMAQGLKLSTIAEGVEQIDQADYLKGIGCNIIQGFLYAKPMPPEEFQKMLQNMSLQTIQEWPELMEEVNINSFFSADSGESKMFDHFIGPAIILDYSKGDMQITRVNDEYMDFLGMRGASLIEIREKILELLTKEDMVRVTEVFQKIIETKKESAITLVYRLPGCKDRAIHHRIMLMSESGVYHTFYCLANEVTL